MTKLERLEKKDREYLSYVIYAQAHFSVRRAEKIRIAAAEVRSKLGELRREQWNNSLCN